MLSWIDYLNSHTNKSAVERKELLTKKIDEKEDAIFIASLITLQIMWSKMRRALIDRFYRFVTTSCHP